MHLVDEKQGTLPCPTADPRVLENFLKLGDARKNRRNLDEGELRLVGEKARDGRLAGPRRGPQKIRLPSVPEPISRRSAPWGPRR
jgi:hypothetical protein